VVPTARGPGRSRPFSDTINQCRRLVVQGYKEIVLTGTHLGTYGEDRKEGKRLLDVMEALEGMAPLGRFRISSIEPLELSDAMVSFFARSSKFCRHLHVPLQSGCDDVLKAMGRAYTVAAYGGLLRRLSESIPGIRLGADAMVGFPGELPVHFERTYQVVEESPLSYLHVFQYSARPGTRAARMGQQVAPKTKKERSVRLRGLSEQKAQAFLRSFLGKTLDVLFESQRDKGTGMLTGLTDNYIRVLCDGPDSLMDALATVHIEQAGDGHATGTVLTKTDA
jgi:threonylcarbamoyladenosine tRNA methylthiotransferase MtaB